jgi:circadian clock protein KaiC
VIAVVKVRGSSHSKELRLYEITDRGIIIGETVAGYDGLLSGSPTKSATSDIDGNRGRRITT